MATPNFGALLDKPSQEVERPKPLPVGTYTCIVQGLPRMDKSSKKQTEFVEFTLKPLAAGDDVDAEALEEIGGIGERTIRATYYVTEDALWRLKKFLVEDLGIEEEEKTLRQMIDEAPGQQVFAHIKHQASQDGTSVFAQLADTAPVE
jgi:hypothetical protein